MKYIKHACGRQQNSMRGKAQQGFALIELIIVISISAILAIYANQELANRSQENIARGGGAYLLTVSQAVERYVFENFVELANSNTPTIHLPVGGVVAPVDPWHPTLQEIINLKRLLGGFPLRMPTRQVVRIDITKTGVCPGVSCQITSTVCTTTPITTGAQLNPPVRFDLAALMVEEQNGMGGQSRYGDGANIRGATLNVVNPMGNVEGIVCGSNLIDLGIYEAFVRIGDTRDPALMGPLTVAGATTFNGVTKINNTLDVTGPTNINNTLNVSNTATFGPCVTIEGGINGNAGFGCVLPNQLPVGYKGVISKDVVGSSNVLASDNPFAFTGANGNFALLTSRNALGVAEIITSGRAAADRLTPTGSYAVGAACTAADEGSIARVSTGSGLVTCGAGTWRTLSLQAAKGDFCSPEGSRATTAGSVGLLCVNGTYQAMSDIIRYGTPGAACSVYGATAIDTANNNEVLLCRTNLKLGMTSYKWIPLRDVTTHIVQVSADVVHNNDVIKKPYCADTISNRSLPTLQLVPKYTSTADGGTAVYAVDNGDTWTVMMKNGAGLELNGAVKPDNPNGLGTAVAQVFCYFP